MARSKDKTRPVILGRIVGLHGVKGWVKVHSYTNPRQAVLDYRDCLLMRSGTRQPARIAEGRAHGKGVVARFDGTADRDEASRLVGAEIAVPREALPDAGEGHFYWTDLEGLTVVHRDGTELGRVAYLLETGANDVLVVQGEREILIPFVLGSVILDVDLAEGRIDVDWEWE